jgi:hypothetical protein
LTLRYSTLVYAILKEAERKAGEQFRPLPSPWNIPRSAFDFGHTVMKNIDPIYSKKHAFKFVSTLVFVT